MVLWRRALRRAVRLADDLRDAHRVSRVAAAGDGRGQTAPLGSYAGAALVAAILASTWWVPGLRSTLVAGGPWLLLLAIGYRLSAAPPNP